VSALFENIEELYRYRALLFSLIVRELQVRYRGSVLGFLWTFLNPVLQMAVYSVVFKVYLRSDEPNYPYFLFVGILPWNWVNTALTTGTSSISDRRDLITKVKFPPQILPMTVIGSAMANYVLSLPLMVLFGVITGVHYTPAVLAFPLIALVQLVLVSGLVYVFASINVTFRDLQHILPNLIMFAFFLTPVLYPLRQIPPAYQWLAVTVNPFAALLEAYRAVFLHGSWPDFLSLARVLGVGVLIFVLGSMFMSARRESFAEFA
jgi:lipopolysaccharide transport system permease protein